MDLKYCYGTLDSKELTRQISFFWDDLRNDPSLRASLSKAGVDLEDLERLLDHIGTDNAIRFSQQSAGLTGAEVAIIVAFAPLANDILYDLWQSFIFPWFKQRLGTDCIGDPKGKDS